MRIFITATNTGVGKTYTTLRLLDIAKKVGLKPGVIKPIETGVLGSPDDGSKLFTKCQELNPSLKSLTLEDIVPYQFELPAAPYIAKGKSSIDIKKIEEKIAKIEALCDILFIEGAGGLMVPIEKDFFMIDLIQALQAQALLVAPSKLGCINDTLLSLQALKNQKISHHWYLNLYEDKEEFFKISYPFFTDYFGKVPLDLPSVFKGYIHRDEI